MPVTKSAKKKLRQDKQRTLANKRMKNAYKELVKNALKDPKAEIIRSATQAIDKAAKKHVLHQNKASRLKSRLAKLLGRTQQKQESQKKQTTRRQRSAPAK